MAASAVGLIRGTASVSLLSRKRPGGLLAEELEDTIHRGEQEYGDKKYLIAMTPVDWIEANQKYDSVAFTYENEYKSIAGYNCQKAVGKLKNGESFTVYFTKELIPENKDFQFSNRSLPGLALEYESNLGKNKVTFSASKISFDPVPAAKFDLPKSGFRVLTYQESKGSGR